MALHPKATTVSSEVNRCMMGFWNASSSVPPMVVLLISLCLFRVVWIQFVLPFFAGIEGVFVLYPVSWALGAVLMALYAWKGSWMTYEHS